MYKDLNNKVVIITGGSGFFGSQLIKAYLKNNLNVINLDLTKQKIINKKLHYFKCNITSEKDLILNLKKIKKKFKNINILVNNAAINHIPSKKLLKNKFKDFDLSNFDKEINVGLKGAILCTKIFGGTMVNQKNGGVIINISSDLGIIAPDQRIYQSTNFTKPVSYSVIKHGIIGLTKYTAAYWGKNKIRCNAFAPGGIQNNQNKKFINNLKKLIPINRMALKNEYNNTILFLSSNHSSYITGATIVADGGRSII